MCNNEIISVLVHASVGMNGGVGLRFVIGRISAEILGALEINRDHALALASADDLVDVHFIIGDDVFVFNAEASQQPDSACENSDSKDHHREHAHHCKIHKKGYLTGTFSILPGIIGKSTKSSHNSLISIPSFKAIIIGGIILYILYSSLRFTFKSFRI